MTFRKVCPSHNGYPGYYAYEYESFWDKAAGKARQRMLRYLGPCDKEGNVLKPPKVQLEGLQSSFAAGRLLVFHAAAEELHVRETARQALHVSDEVAGQFVALVINQATDRVADEHLPEWVGASPLPRLLSLQEEPWTRETGEHLRHWLCYLEPETKILVDQGLELQRALNRVWRAKAREPPGAYYDVTKQAYHGWTNPFAQVGHDSIGGLSTVVGFGMVISSGPGGHPYLCRALPGAQNDSLSVRETIDLLRGWGFRRLRLVMDRGMITEANLKLARGEGYHLIGLVKGWDWETIGLASRWDAEELERSEHAVETSRGLVYARALTTSLFEMPKVQVAVVVNTRRKREDREARDRSLLEWEGPVSKERLGVLKRELRIQNPKLREKGRFAPGLLVLSPGRRGCQVDREAVERDRKLDGRFLIFSTDLSLSGSEMYRAYFARDRIEKVFRTGKGELSLGPIRHHRLDCLCAHATIFYTATLLWSWAERSLKRKWPEMSLSEALRLLENVAWVRFRAGKSVREMLTPLGDQQKEILSALGATRYIPVV
ncbi:MAG: IS1634 family transposase [Thermoplasmata archaeon]